MFVPLLTNNSAFKIYFLGQLRRNKKEIGSRKVTSRGRNDDVRECLIYYSNTNTKVNAVLNCVGVIDG